MDIKNGYCLAQLRQAKILARDGKYDFSIVAVGKGIERLLKELFDELRNDDNSNLIGLSIAYDKAKLKKRWSRSKNGERELNLYGWIKFYQDEEVGIFRKLEEVFNYELNEFNGDNLHQIRISRNEYGAHEDEQYDIHRKLSSTLIDLYSEILSETGRIAQQTSIVPFTRFQQEDINKLALTSEEKSLLKREYDDELRSSPDDTDVLFLRAYLLRGENAALDDLERILILEPNHSEARKERVWNLNNLYLGTPESRRSSPHLTQVNVSFKQNIIQKFSKTRNVTIRILSENRLSFKPTINLFSPRISEEAARHKRDAVITVASIFAVVAIVVTAVVALLGIAALDILKQSPHLLGLIIVIGVFVLWSFIRRL